MKANVSESDHPLLCEGTRRQRGDLATTLLVTYKDDQPKLRKVYDYISKFVLQICDALQRNREQVE